MMMKKQETIEDVLQKQIEKVLRQMIKEGKVHIKFKTFGNVIRPVLMKGKK